MLPAVTELTSRTGSASSTHRQGVSPGAGLVRDGVAEASLAGLVVASNCFTRTGAAGTPVLLAEEANDNVSASAKRHCEKRQTVSWSGR